MTPKTSAPLAAAFAHIRTWVFDLDNTLYPPRYRLFDQIEARMNAYVMRTLGLGLAEASRLRQRYWDDYGTTLAGLMAVHGLDPAPYLADVHGIDFSALPPDPLLAAHIRALPGRKIIFTNATAPYAEQVLAARGLTGLFDAIYGVEHAGFHPKPQPAAYDAVFGAEALDAPRAAMFEDDPRNLIEPCKRGLTCVHNAEKPIKSLHIHHHHTDLTAFLGRLLA